VFYPADGTRALRSSLPRPATRPAPAQASAPAPPPNPSTPALVTVLVAALAGAALSVLLFVAGVLWLRGMPSGRRLHLLWAWLKVAVVVAAAVPFWWMTRGFQRDFRSYLGVALPDVGTTPRRTIVQPWQPLAAGAAGLVYPVVVLTVLRSRTTRDYFRREDEA
jgi:hypothetical protein